MITDEEQLQQVVGQLERMSHALAALRAEVLPKNARQFALIAEGPLDEIRHLQAQIDDYTGVATAEEHDADVWLRIHGRNIAWFDVPVRVLTTTLEAFRKGVQTAAEFLSSGQVGKRPNMGLREACDLRVVALRPNCDIHLVADRDASRQTYRSFYGRSGRSNERPSNYQYFFRAGLTWPRRTDGLSFRIIRRVRQVLETIWKERAEAIEHEACEILGVKELRDYFRKPGNGGFWMDHVRRYSKSRRKAPIYWLLQSSRKTYALWLYYHRLDKDILFKALVNYVEPKLRLEESRLEQLRTRRASVGTSGREAKQLEKLLDHQETFLSELRDFHDKLHRAADLHLEPDLNDGVILNIAPLWELVPWNEAKVYCGELLASKYEWSSIGKQLRRKRLVGKG